MFITSWKLTGILFVLALALILLASSPWARARKLVNAQDRIADAAAEATETIDAIDLAALRCRDGRTKCASAHHRAAFLLRSPIGVRAWLTGTPSTRYVRGVTGVIWIGALEVQSGAMKVGFMQFSCCVGLGVGGFATVAEGDGRRGCCAPGAAERSVEILAQTPDIAAPPSPKPMPAKLSGYVKLGMVFASIRRRRGPRSRTSHSKAFRRTRRRLVCPSARGKSTVFRMPLRFFDPQTGAVTLTGLMRATRILPMARPLR